eukprot:GHVU01024179.1.p1 GENE.GHVU01024179.1~~GHVU01024179.1.p1  ORF type:complete len:714 (+),score=135.02 GHVU01024179.1:235-2376(+)
MAVAGRIDPELKGLLLTVLINTSIFAASCIFFLFLRQIRGDSLVIKEHLIPTTADDDGLEEAARPLRGPREGPTSLSQLSRVKDEAFHSSDIRYYLLFLKISGGILAILSVLGCVVMLPLYITAPTGSSKYVGWLDRFAAEDISGDWRGWAAVCVTILYSFIAYAGVYRYWKAVHVPPPASISASTRPELYTLVVSGFPKHLEAPEELRASLAPLDPRREIVAVHIVFDPPHGYSASPRTSPRDGAAGGGGGGGGGGGAHRSHTAMTTTTSARTRSATVMATTGYSRLEDVTAPTKGENTGVAFVSFASAAGMEAVLAASRAAFWTQLSPLALRRAPHPNDIIWDNLRVHPHARAFRKTVLYSLLVVVSVVLSSSAILTNTFIPLVRSLTAALENKTGTGFIGLTVEAWIAPLMLLLVNSIVLPALVYSVNELVGHWKLSTKSRAILRGNAVFLLLNTFFLPFMGLGTIAGFISEMNKTQIEDWNLTLGRLFFKQSGSFAIRYLLNSCFLTAAAQLIQIPLLCRHLFHSCTSNSNPNGSVNAAAAAASGGPAAAAAAGGGAAGGGAGGGVGGEGAFGVASTNGNGNSVPPPPAPLAPLAPPGPHPHHLDSPDPSSSSSVWSDPPTAPYDFGYWYAFCLAIYNLVIIFSVVVPLVLPIGALLFWLRYWVDKYNFSYGVWKVQIESGGAVAGSVVTYQVLAVVLLQVGRSVGQAL